jgi:hypothetical protein
MFVSAENEGALRAAYQIDPQVPKRPFHATPSKQRCHFPLMIKGRAIYENDCVIPTCPLVIMGHLSTV